MNKFEWYYFDIHTNDGYDLIFTLHTYPFMTRFNISIVDVFIYKNNKELYHHFYTLPVEELKVEDEPFFLQYNPHNYIRTEDGQIDVAANDGQFDLSIRLFTRLSPTGPVCTELLPDKTQNKSFKWVLFVPSCEAQATIKWDDQQLELKGQGYHDYNSGNINLKKVLSGWTWNKYYLNDRILVTGDIRNRNQARRFILAEASSIGIKCDNTAKLICNNDEVKIESTLGIYSIKTIDCHVIDNIRFYLSTYPVFMQFFARVQEVLAQLSLQYRFLKPFQKILTNVKYSRSRSLGLTPEKESVQSFHEEMIF